MLVCLRYIVSILCFFFNDTATTEIYTLSLHDALPICHDQRPPTNSPRIRLQLCDITRNRPWHRAADTGPSLHILIVFHRSEEHTSELQSRQYLVCRLLLEKKKQILNYINKMYIAHITI